MNQRFVRLGFSAGADRLTITPPSVGEIAPPGHYMLFLLNGAGVPSVASIVRLSADIVPSPPTAPATLTANAASSSQINLSWTDNASDESGFRIERSPDGTTFAEITTVGANVTTFADVGLTASTRYWYRIRAYNNTGPSSYAGPASATTLAPPPQPPSAPTALIGTLKSGQIALAWTDTSNNETGFAIYRSIDDGKSYSQLATVAQNVSTYVDTGPGTSKFVSYRVRAFNTVGNSAFSNTVKVRNR
jgi:predicted phage tail protein